MSVSKQLKLQHLLWRTGFGPATAEWKSWESRPESTWWSKIKELSTGQPEYYDVADNAVKGLLMGAGEIGRMESDNLDRDKKRQIRRQSREDLRNLNVRWLNEMIYSKAQLREKMALFWHGHFASRNINILYQQQLLDILRKNALGNFGDLLRAVSKSAAMLAFLNNQQNKKQHPNENFAREVMELFTLGRGHYTEDDIKEAARAFTGWGFELNGDFVFRQRAHDEGQKTVLGKTGPFNGDDVLDILLQQPQTAVYITRKIYRFIVNEEIVPEDRIQALATRFLQRKYSITGLLDDIVGSPWFYDPENIGARIKSPVELWVGLRRILPFEPRDPLSQILVQNALGQTLFYPPNVAGWPGGRAWIDASSLMLRLRLPQLVAWQGDFNVQTKDDDDQNMGEGDALRERQKRLVSTVNWTPVLDLFGKTPDDQLVDQMARYLWQLPDARPPVEIVEEHTDRGSREKRIKTTFIQLMATPEFQLC